MKKDQVQIARKYKREIAKLQKEKDKLFAKAIKELDINESTAAIDYFYSDPVGYNSFEEGLRENS